MLGALLQQAKADAYKIASAGGFQIDAVMKAANGTELAVTGLATGTWMVFEDTSSGKPMNSTSDSFTVHENLLIAGSFPYKDNRGRIYLLDCTVIRDDGAGMTGTFKVTEQHPNATLGLIILILSRKN